MFYTPDEHGWITKKSREIAHKTGWPLPVARSEAMAELRRLRRLRRPGAFAIGQRPAHNELKRAFL